jgi:hypothetical protein
MRQSDKRIKNFNNKIKRKQTNRVTREARSNEIKKSLKYLLATIYSCHLELTKFSLVWQLLYIPKHTYILYIFISHSFTLFIFLYIAFSFSFSHLIYLEHTNSKIMLTISKQTVFILFIYYNR